VTTKKARCCLYLYNDQQIVCPRSAAKTVMEAAHAEHFGYHCVFSCVYKEYENVTKLECKNYCKNCPECAMYNPRKKDPHVMPIISTLPFEHVQIDLKDLSGYKDDNDGYRYALNIVDHFSSYPWTFLLKDKTAESVMKCLKDFFKLFGCPDIIQSDNGGEFIGDGKPRTPREQGKVERFNGTFGEKLEKMMSERKTRRWIDLYEDFLQAYRETAIPDMKNKSPYEIFFHRVPAVIQPTPEPPIAPYLVTPNLEDSTEGLDDNVKVEFLDDNVEVEFWDEIALQGDDAVNVLALKQPQPKLLPLILVELLNLKLKNNLQGKFE